ncbi:class IV adenylate cyclase [Halobacterium litoreum]|uniref:Class IV adenylate cyclase n=1 Tax=Halobacterium litoreum TaxID=2039234 RepID=A0ABD5NCJ0_9EURY|nr:class IV adenylate cyclase [Halobacterium litoreum]UHH14492.1 class IV adenylate cyclase [Halobacterium litoreum]
MYEVEVKVPASHDAVREALADAGATPDGTVAQSDTYFDAPHRTFAETDEALRVRRVATATDALDRDAGDVSALVDAILDGDVGHDAESRVTYKGPLVEAASKTREEFETGVEGGDEMREILERLGFEPAAVVRKVRERYRLDGFTVLLDAVEGVGEYVEIETEVETEGDVEAAREAAYAVLRDLGLDPADQIRTSYLGLRLEDA